MSGSEISVTPQNSEPKDGGGKKASDFVSADTKIDAKGNVTGTLKYVEGVTSFGADEQEGNFFPITLDSKYQGKQITCVNTGGSGKTVTSNDLDWLLRVKDKNVTFKFSTVEDGDILTLTFKNATLNQKSEAIKSALKTPVMSVSEAQEEPLEYADEDITLESETTAEKHYTKSEINRMNTEDLQALAAEKGIEGAYDMTGSELKPILIEMLVN